MEYVTKIRDCDLHLLDFLSISDIIKLRLINRSLNMLITNYDIYSMVEP